MLPNDIKEAYLSAAHNGNIAQIKEIEEKRRPSNSDVRDAMLKACEASDNAFDTLKHLYTTHSNRFPHSSLISMMEKFLQTFASSQNERAVKWCLENKAPVMASNPKTIHEAIKPGNSKILIMILDHVQSVPVTQEMIKIACVLAIDNQAYDIIKELHNHSAYSHLMPDSDVLVSHAAANDNIKAVKYLVENMGTDVTFNDNALIQKLPRYTGNMNLYSYLEANGAAFDPENLVDVGKQCLAQGHNDLLDHLIEKYGFDINGTINPENGQKFIHYAACRTNNPDCMRLALAKGANVYICDAYGHTALSYAISQHTYAVVDDLIKHHAHYAPCTLRPLRTALEWAHEFNWPAGETLLQEAQKNFINDLDKTLHLKCRDLTGDKTDIKKIFYQSTESDDGYSIHIQGLAALLLCDDIENILSTLKQHPEPKDIMKHSGIRENHSLVASVRHPHGFFDMNLEPVIARRKTLEKLFTPAIWGENMEQMDKFYKALPSSLQQNVHQDYQQLKNQYNIKKRIRSKRITRRR